MALGAVLSLLGAMAGGYGEGRKQRRAEEEELALSRLRRSTIEREEARAQRAERETERERKRADALNLWGLLGSKAPEGTLSSLGISPEQEGALREKERAGAEVKALESYLGDEAKYLPEYRKSYEAATGTRMPTRAWNVPIEGSRDFETLEPGQGRLNIPFIGGREVPVYPTRPPRKPLSETEALGSLIKGEPELGRRILQKKGATSVGDIEGEVMRSLLKIAPKEATELIRNKLRIDAGQAVSAKDKAQIAAANARALNVLGVQVEGIRSAEERDRARNQVEIWKERNRLLYTPLPGEDRPTIPEEALSPNPSPKRLTSEQFMNLFQNAIKGLK